MLFLFLSLLRKFVYRSACHVQVAEAMGVVSLRGSMLAQTADSMQLSTDSMEAFGQSEALTTRLKHIVSDYEEGPAILNELTQNAGVPPTLPTC